MTCNSRLNLIIPQYFKHYAHDLTIERIKQNRERYKDTEKQRSGTIISALLGEVSREYYTEFLGILAEIIVRDYYDKDLNCSNFSVSTFIKTTKIVENDTDIKVKKNGKIVRISVKGCEESLKVNKQAADSEISDFYIFVFFFSEMQYDLYSFTASEIKKWKLKQGFSPYYEHKIIRENPNQLKFDLDF